MGMVGVLEMLGRIMLYEASWERTSNIGVAGCGSNACMPLLSDACAGRLHDVEERLAVRTRFENRFRSAAMDWGSIWR